MIDYNKEVNDIIYSADNQFQVLDQYNPLDAPENKEKSEDHVRHSASTSESAKSVIDESNDH